MIKNLSVVILAAGMGSRMKSSTPKVLHLLGNAPMIDHLLYKSSQLQATEVVSVISNDMQNVQSTIENSHLIDNSKVAYQKDRLGTAHAVLVAKNMISNNKGVLLVLYGDTPLVRIEQLQHLIDLVNHHHAHVAVLGFIKEEENSYGKLIIDEEHRIVAIKEDAQCNEDEKAITICNSGVMAIDLQHAWTLLESINNDNSKEEYYLTDIIAIANKKDLVCKYILDTEENLQGANSKLELAQLENTFQNQKRIEFLNNGVQLIDPSTIYFSLDTEIEQDVVIYPNVYFFNKVVVKQGTIIYPNSVLEGATVGENCNIGPFARLRPETVLQGHNNVGNFVETKKSTIGKGSKVNHLTYIGDTTMGESCNIGAGTITCNYDGINKFNTIIGNHVFIGSNNSLVAPVEIGDNATTGAGSTIVENVEPRSLAIARGMQKNILNWKQ